MKKLESKRWALTEILKLLRSLVTNGYGGPVEDVDVGRAVVEIWINDRCRRFEVSIEEIK